MSATFDDTERAEFGEALVQQTIDTLAGWLVKDSAVPPRTEPSDAALFLVVYYAFVIAGRRRGAGGVTALLASAREIAGLAGVTG